MGAREQPVREPEVHYSPPPMEALFGPVYLAGLLLALGGAAKAFRPVPTAGALRALHLPGPRWGVRALGAIDGFDTQYVGPSTPRIRNRRSRPHGELIPARHHAPASVVAGFPVSIAVERASATIFPVSSNAITCP